MKIRRRFWLALALVILLAIGLRLYDGPSGSVATAPAPIAPASQGSAHWSAGRFLDAVNEEARRDEVRWTMHLSDNENRVELEIVGAEAGVDKFYHWLEKSGAQEIETLEARARAGGQLQLVIGYAT